MLACWRCEAAPAGDAERGAVARDAGGEGGRLGEAESEAVGGGGLAAISLLRLAVGGDHRAGPGEQPGGGGHRAPEMTIDQPLEENAEEGGGQEGEAEDGRLAPVEGPELIENHLPLADEQRSRRAGVQRDAEGLLQIGVSVLSAPAEEPGDESEVSGARDREQLGRSLDRAEDDRPRRLHQLSVAGSTRPRLRFQSAYAIRATIAASTA